MGGWLVGFTGVGEEGLGLTGLFVGGADFQGWVSWHFGSLGDFLGQSGFFTWGFLTTGCSITFGFSMIYYFFSTFGCFSVS